MIGVAVIGRVQRREVAPVMDWLTARSVRCVIHHFATIPKFCAAEILANWHPDLVVILESHPDEFSRSDLDQLSQRAPLARWVVCAGAWCESAARTRELWPLAVRTPLHAAKQRLDYEWTLVSEGTAAAVPPSASREECFLRDYPPLTRASVSVPVGIETADSAYRAYLVDLLLDAGHTVVDPGIARLVIRDLDPWPTVRARMNAGNESTSRVPELGLMEWPDPEHVSEALEAGIVAVVAKLTDQRELLDTLVRISETGHR